METFKQILYNRLTLTKSLGVRSRIQLQVLIYCKYLL